MRPQWIQLAALIASFGVAVGLGLLLGRFLLEPSELATGISCFAFLLILFMGYQLWITFIAAAVSRGFLRGFWNSMMRFVFRRDDQTVREAAEDLLKNLKDENSMRELMEAIRRKTSVFRAMGLVFGITFGFVLSFFWSASGFWLTLLVYSLSGFLYGWALTVLGREGYLPIPEDIDF